MNIATARGRLPNLNPVGVVDIGSNSVRLVVYEGITRSPSILFNEKVMAGLGRGLSTTGRLDETSVERAVHALQRFRGLATQLDVTELHVLATAAAREAENGESFIEQARQILGTDIQVLTGKQEAYYSALGIISGIFAADGVTGDLGGGSLELVDVRGNSVGDGITLPIGALRLKEMSDGDLDKARAIVREEIKRAKILLTGKGRHFYGVGGTWRNLAKMHMRYRDYPLQVIHHYDMQADQLNGFLKRICRHDIEEIDGYEVVGKNRRALISYGAIVLDEVLRAMKPKSVVMSALGVREGLMYSLLDPAQKLDDPLLSAAGDMSTLRARAPEHGLELGEWTQTAFQLFELGETADESRYRRAACLLADIGWRAHSDYRAQQAYNIIANGSFIGVDHPGRAYLALTTYFRHEGLMDDSDAPDIIRLAPARIVERTKVLAALMRVAYLFSAAMPGVLPRLQWRDASNGGYELVLPSGLAHLYGERPINRLQHLSSVVGVELALSIDKSAD